MSLITAGPSKAHRHVTRLRPAAPPQPPRSELGPIRGILVGLLLVLPLWIAIGLALYHA